MRNRPHLSNLFLPCVNGVHLSLCCQEAVARGVCMVWDAEQTYLHPAIDLLVLHQMRLFNRERVVVYGTYQCYLQVRTKRDVVSFTAPTSATCRCVLNGTQCRTLHLPVLPTGAYTFRLLPVLHTSAYLSYRTAAFSTCRRHSTSLKVMSRSPDERDSALALRSCAGPTWTR